MTELFLRARAFATQHPRLSAAIAAGVLLLLIILAAFGEGESFSYAAF
jgi:hypothetical protein